jgi:hypothetical protein
MDCSCFSAMVERCNPGHAALQSDDPPSAGQSAAEGFPLSRHEFRTPLLAIKAALELLSSGAGGPLAAPARGLVQDAGRATSSLERIGEMLFRLAELPTIPCDGPSRVPWACLSDELGTAPRREGGTAIWAAPRHLCELFKHLRAAGFVAVPEAERDALPGRDDLGEMTVRMAESGPSNGEGAMAVALASRLAAVSHGRMRVEEDGAILLAWRLVS